MVIHAAEQAGSHVPHFCYHKKLSIVASCRMCLVEVEKQAKPVPACATPVTQGMVVHTRSPKAIKAQQDVMEFLLINHPLDCPVCDKAGECQLQDLSMGYGKSTSRYREEKRSVSVKDVGPLISMQEMARCIQCTRCIRFGEEIAGEKALGQVFRGEHSEIAAFVASTIHSELSGNMIDICPVGAITSKPFRYSARTWELGRRKSISPHDSTGTNLIVQVKDHRVMRVQPFENEAINECWIADRDRFSYEALNSPERLTSPMIKQIGEWRTVDWQTAINYVVHGLLDIKQDHGADSIGALVSPHSTVEELWLAAKLVRGLGSDNIDHRLRQAEFTAAPNGKARWLGLPIAQLSTLERVLVIGSNLRKDHPLFAQRIRQAVRRGAQLCAVFDQKPDWAIPLHSTMLADACDWTYTLAGIANAVAAAKGLPAPFANAVSDAATVTATATDTNTAAAQAIAQSLLGGERKALLLGNAAAHHPQAASLLALAQWIAQETGATWGYLTEAANTVGAQCVAAQPCAGGKNAAQMVQGGGLKAALLLHTEPRWDCAAGTAALQGLNSAHMVVTLSPYQTNLDISDVLLPISPFSETSGSFVNAEGRLQGFHAVVKPLGETRPAWKVLSALARVIGLPESEFENSQQVLAQALPNATAGSFVAPAMLDNHTEATPHIARATTQPATASIYQLDALVRRAPALQQTADAQAIWQAQQEQQPQGGMA